MLATLLCPQVDLTTESTHERSDNHLMSDPNTDKMDGKRPFEERVFARFDAVDSPLNEFEARFDNVDARFDAVDSRLQKLEIRAYDTKPIWEQALREIVDTRRELSKRLDRIEAITIETRADLRDVKDRLDKIERKPPVQ